jgi:predicted transcriptional regulator
MSQESEERISAQFEESAREGYAARIDVHLNRDLSSKLELVAEKRGLDRVRFLARIIEQEIDRQWQAVIDVEGAKEIDPETGWSMDDLELFNFAGIDAGNKPADPTEVDGVRDRAYRAIPKKLRAEARSRRSAEASGGADEPQGPS